jgi:hypothetical protein
VVEERNSNYSCRKWENALYKNVVFVYNYLYVKIILINNYTVSVEGQVVKNSNEL